MISDREVATAAKEQDLDRVQQLKDAAVAVIAEARAIHQLTASDAADGHNRDNRVSSSLVIQIHPNKIFLIKQLKMLKTWLLRLSHAHSLYHFASRRM